MLVPSLKPVQKVALRSEKLSESIRNYARERSIQRSKILNVHTVAELDDVKVKLTSPVSSQMKNTFILKASNRNMEAMYRNLMHKKKQQLYEANHSPEEQSGKLKKHSSM